MDGFCLWIGLSMSGFVSTMSGYRMSMIGFLSTMRGFVSTMSVSCKK